jgi:DNA-binding MarR family transcriptional regulator/catechol 2,3-dioxygenase-like lactoylglutathione lyase family enzyme
MATKDPSASPLARRLVRAVAAVSRRMRSGAGSGLPSAVTLNTLALLRESPGGLTAGSLAAANGIKPQSISRVLAALEREGLACLAEGRGDQRTRLLKITERGVAVLRQAAARRAAWLDAAMDGALDTRERRVLGIAGAILLRLAGVSGGARAVGRQWDGRTIPVFPIRDVERSARFYAALGFDVERLGTTGAFAARRDVVLMLLVEPEIDPERGHGTAYLSTPDVKALHEAFRASGVAPEEAELSGEELRVRARLGPLEDKPWRAREFTLRDPDGNWIQAGQAIVRGVDDTEENQPAGR